jgi:hypothetical protein
VRLGLWLAVAPYRLAKVVAESAVDPDVQMIQPLLELGVV